MQPNNNNNNNPLGDIFGQFAQMMQNMQGGLQNAMQNNNNGGNANPFGLGDLANIVQEGTAGSGAVKVSMNGAGEVTAVKIDPKVVDSKDVDTLQDLIVTALGDARQKLEDAAKERIKGLGNMGGLGNLFGGLFGNMGANNNAANNNNAAKNDAPKKDDPKKSNKKSDDK